MDWTVWMMFVATEGALTVTPGPAVLFIVSQGLRYGTGDALWSALGILAVNALYFTASGTGVGALLAASTGWFTVVKWAGAAYLAYLGAMSLLRPPRARRRELPGTAQGSPARSSLFWSGFVLQLSNPKALLFFVAILPQFIDRGGPVVVQILVFGATSIVLELLVLAVYGFAASRAAGVATGPRFALMTSRLSGVLLVGAALGLVRVKR